MANDPYSYGKGRIYITDLSDSAAKERFLGDVSALSLKFSTEKVSHVESYTGQNVEVESFVKSKSGSVDLTMHWFNQENLALALYGGTKKTTGSTVTEEALPDSLAAGDSAALKHGGVSAVTITDSSGTPASLTEGTDYTVDATFGRITIVDVGSYTQPFKVSYTFADEVAVGMMAKTPGNFVLRYEGINLASGADRIVQLWKVSPEPLQELALISDGDDVDGMQITGNVLLDSSQPVDTDLGQFGRITIPGTPA